MKNQVKTKLKIVEVFLIIFTGIGFKILAYFVVAPKKIRIACFIIN